MDCMTRTSDTEEPHAEHTCHRQNKYEIWDIARLTHQPSLLDERSCLNPSTTMWRQVGDDNLKIASSPFNEWVCAAPESCSQHHTCDTRQLHASTFNQPKSCFLLMSTVVLVALQVAGHVIQNESSWGLLSDLLRGRTILPNGHHKKVIKTATSL